MPVAPSPNPSAPVIPLPTPGTPPETPETPPPAAAEKQEDRLSKQFGVLSKKEKMLFRQGEALKAERAAFEAEKARVAAIEAKYGARPSTPREALERYGYDYKTATEFELNDNAPTAEFLARQAQDQVRRLEESLAARDRKEKEDQIARAEQEKTEVVQDFKTEIQEFITEKAEEYELIKFHNAYDSIYQTIEQHYAKTNRLLSIPEAANIVEKFLEKQLDDLQATKKFAAKTRPQGDPPTPESGFGRQTPATAQRRTLDNTVTSSTPTLVTNPRIEDDRMKRALAALG